MDVCSDRRSPSVRPPSTKPPIRVVTPPLRYSPKSMQQHQPLQSQQLPPTSLPFSAQLSSLTAGSVHHPAVSQTAAIVDQHSMNNVVSAASLQHHYTPPTSQPPTTFPPSQHPLPHTHSQYSSSSHYPPVNCFSEFSLCVFVTSVEGSYFWLTQITPWLCCIFGTFWLYVVFCIHVDVTSGWPESLDS